MIAGSSRFDVKTKSRKHRAKHPGFRLLDGGLQQSYFVTITVPTMPGWYTHL